MKKIVLYIACSFHLLAYAQAPGPSRQWEQQVNFLADVTLNENDHSLEGRQQIEYTNRSPDTLSFIWFHVWANAFKNDRTAFSEQLLQQDRTDFYFSSQDQKGYINRLDFKVNGITAKTEDHPKYIDVVKLLLPRPLPPGAQVTITTPFHVKLPYNFSGNGYQRNTWQVAQWNPKPARYDQDGWHPMPYLDNSFSEKGNYDVRITAPFSYTISAAGELVETTSSDGNQVLHYRLNNADEFVWQAVKPGAARYTRDKEYISDTWRSAFDTLVKRKLSTAGGGKKLSLFPAAGYNVYDALMIGGIVHNYQSTTDQRLRFIAIPLYATGSKTLNGLGRVSYSWLPGGKIGHIDAGAAVSTFSYNNTPAEVQPLEYARFVKLAPFIKLTLRETRSFTKVNRYAQLKHFYIKEEGFGYRETPDGLKADRTSTDNHLTQLKFVVSNTRKLYPYRGELNLEHHKDFIRAGFTGNYYFNFSNNKNGLDVRVFAGKLFYKTSATPFKRFQASRYHLTMTGADGEEDYTYSDYFIGRSEFEGFESQQIRIRDGGFKVRTDLLSDQVGKTDDWLAAVNFSTHIPGHLNPLSILPIRIPLKVFADIGTYAGAWDRNAEADRFLFDAGLQVSLLKESLQIYFPFIYSKAYKDYFRSYLGDKRFWKTVSFSINIQNLLPSRAIPALNF